MGRKFKCDSTSLSSCSSSSNSFINCCKKYPKCKCAPIYYPNNCNPYPCGPCSPNPCPPNPCPPNFCLPNPCGPCPPYPICPPPNCGTSYTSNPTIITTSSSLTSSTQNINICNPTSDITLTLPNIASGLQSCGYKKMYVISNISANNTVTILPTVSDVLTNTSLILNSGESATLYSVYIGPSSTNYWVVQV